MNQSLKIYLMHYIEAMYCQTPDNIKANYAKELSLTYGDIFLASLDQICDKLNISSEDVIMELGSGIGKLVTFFYLLTPAKKVAGFEIIPARYQYAEQIKAQIQAEIKRYMLPEKEIHFYQQDFTEVSLKQATILFMDSTCFPKKLMHLIRQKIQHYPNIIKIASFKAIALGPSYRLATRYKAECSWGSRDCYIYEKTC